MGTMALQQSLLSVLHSNSEAAFCGFLVRYSTSGLSSRAKKISDFFHLGSSSGSDDDVKPETAITAGYPGEYPRATVLCELLQEAVSHALERGLPFAEVYRFTRLYVQCLGLLTGSTGDTLPTLATSVKKFKNMVLKCATDFSHDSLISIIEYITTTLFQHYHLYQYLLTEDQPQDLTLLRLDVETANNDPPRPLNTSISASEMERREKLKELESMQAEKEKKHIQSREVVLQQESEHLMAVYGAELSRMQTMPKSEITEEQISHIIDSLAKAHVQSTKTAISQDLEKHELDIGFRVQKLEIISPRGVEITPQPRSPCKSSSPSKNGRQ